MGKTFELILFIVWLPQALRQLLLWTYWWQVKEYRLDRFLAYLATEDGREKLNINFVIVKFILISLSFIQIYFFSFLFIILLWFDFKLSLEVIKKRLRKPVFTQRVQKILATGLFFIILTCLLVFWNVGVLKQVLLGEISLLIAPYLGILWTIPIVNRIKRGEIEEAKKILSKFRPTVIAVSGSYGKTTTKDFIAHLLSQKFKVAKTIGSENTEFGIARNVIEFVKEDTQIFVVEMGAYREGEISKLSEIVKPSIGILTGIEEQHLALFGSLEKIKNTKFELIESLPEGGIAVFNFTNKYCKELAKKAKHLPKNLKIYGYSVDESDSQWEADVVARILSINTEHVEFEVTYLAERKVFRVRLPGVHFIENLTCAILVARLLKLDWKQIENGCKSLQTPESTMKVYKLKGGCTIIDDTFNATPKGFEAALKYLFLFQKKKKVVVTSGIIELGSLTDQVHERLGKIMKGKVNEIILLNEVSRKGLSRSLLGSSKIDLLKDPGEVIPRLKSLEMRNCVILFEGRMPRKVKEFIESEKND